MTKTNLPPSLFTNHEKLLAINLPDLDLEAYRNFASVSALALGAVFLKGVWYLMSDFYDHNCNGGPGLPTKTKQEMQKLKQEFFSDIGEVFGQSFANELRAELSHLDPDKLGKRILKEIFKRDPKIDLGQLRKEFEKIEEKFSREQEPSFRNNFCRTKNYGASARTLQETARVIIRGIDARRDAKKDVNKFVDEHPEIRSVLQTDQGKRLMQAYEENPTVQTKEPLFNYLRQSLVNTQTPDQIERMISVLNKNVLPALEALGGLALGILSLPFQGRGQTGP